MLKSMTGYGSGHFKNDQYSISIEIKSLNSKFFDIQIKSPRILSEKEIDIKNLVSEKLLRGKINIGIDFIRESSAVPAVRINEALFLKYYSILKDLVNKTGDQGNDLFSQVMEMPEVVIPSNENVITGDEWVLLSEILSDAVEKCDQFRIKEGNSLQEKILQYISSIDKSLIKIKNIEGERLEKIKEKLKSNISQLESELVDQNRLEQEIIFYSERLDITEEIVRLKTHLNHFEDAVNEINSNGKKLGFIAQEIGREINTIGSKANYAPMQKLVVEMKDELEKIKEQCLNIL